MKKILASILFASLSTSVFAETSVWKATKGEATVYLGGTIHVLRPSDYPLPEEFEKAYQNSQIVTLETNIAELSTPAMAQKMMSILSYSDERTLQSVVSEETYKALEKQAESIGLSLNFFRKAKPGLIMSTMLMAELQKLGVSHQGIDAFFEGKARTDAKQLKYLETADEQLSFLAELGEGDEDSFYKKMLKDIDQTKSLFFDMIKVWRNGDSQGLDKIANQSMRRDYPKMYQSLLVDRNNNWMPLLEKYFKTPEIEFVLVGAAHLIGEHGVVEQLKRKGYKVEKL
ncbi:MAG: TraB/GumN family protein [Kangiellaceae bacterium]|nr:TraB/GumN family protein [Kangiellaceae bacterium]MCW8999708.1 TraB/GumN family protein [Kangiellaceae bacterium]MCW9015816.1 TraB/GumN family protein [Kangiellaceae bacterium]